MMSGDDRLQRAIDHIKAGRKTTGGRILAEFVRQEPNNESAWLWLSTVVVKTNQRRYCLERVLQIDPDNRSAKTMLQNLDRSAREKQPRATPLESRKPASLTKWFSWKGLAAVAIVLALLGCVSFAGAIIVSLLDGSIENISLNLIPTGEYVSSTSASLFTELQVLDTYPCDNSFQSLAWSPDGQTLVSGSDRFFCLWDTSSGKLTRSIDLSYDIQSVAWSPNGQSIACGTRKGYVYILDAQSGAFLTTLRMEGDVLSVAWSPDGAMLASGSQEDDIWLWDTSTYTPIRSLAGHSDDVQRLTFSPDGQLLASGSLDGTIRLWDVQTGSTRQLFDRHEWGRVTGPDWSSDGKLLAGTVSGEGIQIWDTQTGELMRIVDENVVVGIVAWSPDDTLLAGTSGERVLIWEAKTGVLLETLRGHGRAVTSLAWSPDGDIIASGDGDIRLWIRSSLVTSAAPSPMPVGASPMPWPALAHPRTRITRDNVTDLTDPLNLSAYAPSGLTFSASWHPTNPRILASGHAGKVNIWDVETGGLLQTLDIADEEYLVWGLAWSPDGGTLAIGASWWPSEGIVYLWDVQTGDLTQVFSGYGHVVNSVAWSPDGQTLASGSYDGEVHLWDDHGGAVFRVPDGYRDAVRDMSWSPDGRTLAVAYDYQVDGGFDYDTVRLWDIDSGTIVETFSVDRGRLQSVAWSPDGQKLVVGGVIPVGQWKADDVVYLWDPWSDTLPRRLETGEYGESRGMHAVAWSPDQKLVLGGGGFNGRLHLWDTETGALLLTTQGHTQVFDVDWSPDGGAFVAASHYGWVEVWMIP